MFLSMLKEENKERFLEICVFASVANGVFEEKEKEMIYAYCNEMQIEKKIPSISESVELLLEKLREKCSDEEKRIITLELMGVLYSDGDFDETEVDFLNKCVQSMGISKEVFGQIKELFERYLEIYKQMSDVIFK